MQAHQADAIAASLGLQKVGVLFSQSTSQADKYIINDVELAMACSVQAEVGEHCVIAVFIQREEEGRVCHTLTGFLYKQRLAIRTSCCRVRAVCSVSVPASDYSGAIECRCLCSC